MLTLVVEDITLDRPPPAPPPVPPPAPPTELSAMHASGDQLTRNFRGSTSFAEKQIHRKISENEFLLSALRSSLQAQLGSDVAMATAVSFLTLGVKLRCDDANRPTLNGEV